MEQSGRLPLRVLDRSNTRSHANAVCEHVFVPTYSYTLIEHDPDKPWLVISIKKHMTIQLDDGRSFFDWAQEKWPRDCYTVEIDPYQL
jgi:hypothetical protein